MNQAQFHETLELDAIKWIGERRVANHGMYRMGFHDGLDKRFRYCLDGVRDYRAGLLDGEKKRNEEEDSDEII